MYFENLLREWSAIPMDHPFPSFPRLQHCIAFEDSTPDIDTPEGVRVISHSDRNEHNQRWREDFRLVKKFGFPLMRIGVSWNVVQVGPDTFHWHLIDEQLAYARELGLEVIFALTHYGWRSETNWFTHPEGLHPVENPVLPKQYAMYTQMFVKRYHDFFPGTIVGVMPAVEINTDLHHRCEVEEGQVRSSWAPHYINDLSARERIRSNLARAWNASAEILRRHGVRVVLCEYAPALVDTVPLLSINPERDIVGMDYYHHSFHGRERKYHTLLQYLIRWHAFFLKKYRKPVTFMIPEYGVPESWNAFEMELEAGKIIPSGMCENRVEDMNQLSYDVEIARAGGVRVAAVFAYLLGGLWHDCLRGEVGRDPCNRNGLVDLEWSESKGHYVRTPCTDLIEKFKKVGRQGEI